MTYHGDRCRVGTARRAIGLSQSDFAEVLGVHPLTISKWERGVNRPSAWYQELVARIERAAKAGVTGDRVRRVLAGCGSVEALTMLLRKGAG